MQRIIFLTFLCSSIWACSQQVRPSAIPSTPFDAFVGHWEGPLGGGTYIEKWEKVSAEHLRGEGFWIRGQDTILAEDLRIQKIGIHWSYIAIINNSAPTLFTLTKMEDQSWIFENKEHDYPQIIGYQQEDVDHLFAWTDGTVKGKQRKDEYKLARVK